MNGRKITGIILVIIGAAVAVFGVLTNDGSGTFGPLIGAALIAAGISYGQLGKKAKSVSSEHAAACREDLPPRHEMPPRTEHVQKTYNVAGVTFANEDGTSRQQLLRELIGHTDGSRCALAEFSYNGEPAFKVIVDGKTIGNIRRSDLSYLTDHKDDLSGVVGLDVDAFVNDDDEELCRAELTVSFSVPEPEPVAYAEKPRRDSGAANQPLQSEKTRIEKPIYKKWWFWLIVLVFIGNLYNRVSSSIHEKQLTDPAYIAKTLDVDKSCGIALLDAERKIGIDPNGVSDYMNSGSECCFSYNGHMFAVVISDNKIKSIRCGTMLFFKNGAALDDVKTRLISLDQMACLQSAAKKALEEILKSSSTAQYPGEGKYNSFDGWNFLRDGDTFTVSSYVDAQNSFGSIIRSNFTVTIAWNGNTNVSPTATNVLFDGKTYASN